jgi:hypothetical protein
MPPLPDVETPDSFKQTKHKFAAGICSTRRRRKRAAISDQVSEKAPRNSG